MWISLALPRKCTGLELMTSSLRRLYKIPDPNFDASNLSKHLQPATQSGPFERIRTDTHVSLLFLRFQICLKQSHTDVSKTLCLLWISSVVFLSSKMDFQQSYVSLFGSGVECTNQKDPSRNPYSKACVD
jgi:hypothetical protein